MKKLYGIMSILLVAMSTAHAGVRDGLWKIWDGTQEVAVGLFEAAQRPFQNSQPENAAQEEKKQITVEEKK